MIPSPIFIKAQSNIVTAGDFFVKKLPKRGNMSKEDTITNNFLSKQMSS